MGCAGGPAGPRAADLRLRAVDLSLIALGLALASPDAASCAGCHPEEHASWRTSRHAVAASNPIFRASWEAWPNGWCLGCHAPGEEAQTDLLGHVARPGVLQRLVEPPGDRWRDGVDCVACHDREGRIATARAPTAAGEAMHALVHEPSLATEALCARCHEFAFQTHTPRFPFGYGDELAQATVSEWRASPAHASGVGCVGCHMGVYGHRFPGAHDVDLVRGAIRAGARVDGADVVFEISAHDAGHAVPTGDPFRRLEVQLCDTADCRAPRTVSWIQRTLERTETSWRVASDARLGESARLVRVPRGTAVAWQLVYRYGDRRFEPVLPASSVGFVVAGGTLQESR
ncbi:MAG: hypothetical protein H6734_20275 [Alphaproteobacteria bacterium]|nr:hypothetical protein [Alphaproteobacteria bacterium]